MIGIYKITNTANGKVYIGQSKNIERRIVDHKTKLRNNKHPSIEMQADWNSTKDVVWTFEVLQECSADMLNELEDKFIREAQSISNGYNQYSSIRSGDNDSLLSAKRIEKGLSQSQLAVKSGVSIRMIQYYEQGRNDINKAEAGTVKKIAQALGCAIEDIID